MIGRRPLLATLLVLLAQGACGGEMRFGTEPTDALDLVDTGGDGGDTSSGCQTDVDCPLPTLHCEPTSRQCVACLADVHCTTAGLLHCDLALHVCVQCTSFRDCDGTELCEATTRTCVRTCASPSTCPATTPRCDTTRGICIECKNAGECTVAGDRRVCDPGNGRCVQCTLDTHCLPARPHCDLTRGTCVRCQSSADCPADKPVCDPIKEDCV